MENMYSTNVDTMLRKSWKCSLKLHGNYENHTAKYQLAWVLKINDSQGL